MHDGHTDGGGEGVRAGAGAGRARAVQPGRFPDTYRVLSDSRDGVWHSVGVDGERFTCTCESAVRPACWHRAAVAIYRLEQGGGAGDGGQGAGARPPPCSGAPGARSSWSERRR